MAYFFELPLITNLTEDQQMALDEINPIAISGGAGTGKTVVSLWRHIQNIETLGKYSILVTFTKTLTTYLVNSGRSIESQQSNKNILPSSAQIFGLKDFPFVKSPYDKSWRVHEIIIDEAQDLSLSTLKAIKTYGDTISYGADFNQQLYSGTIEERGIQNLFPRNIHYNLQQNFRNSYHILNFVKGILPNLYIPQNTLNELEYENKGIKPILFISNNNFDKEIKKIIEIINQFKSNTHNIAILLPFGEENNYTNEQNVDRYYDALSTTFNCSKYYNKMNINYVNIENIHITTFKSAKGLEFDTVIIPQIDKMVQNINNEKSLTQEEDYYVAFTRAKRNLYLFSSNEVNFINNSICEIEYLNNSHYNKVSIPEMDIDDDEIPF